MPLHPIADLAAPRVDQVDNAAIVGAQFRIVSHTIAVSQAPQDSCPIQGSDLIAGPDEVAQLEIGMIEKQVLVVLEECQIDQVKRDLARSTGTHQHVLPVKIAVLIPSDGAYSKVPRKILGSCECQRVGIPVTLEYE